MDEAQFVSMLSKGIEARMPLSREYEDTMLLYGEMVPHEDPCPFEGALMVIDGCMADQDRKTLCIAVLEAMRKAKRAFSTITLISWNGKQIDTVCKCKRQGLSKLISEIPASDNIVSSFDDLGRAIQIVARSAGIVLLLLDERMLSDLECKCYHYAGKTILLTCSTKNWKRGDLGRRPFSIMSLDKE